MIRFSHFNIVNSQINKDILMSFYNSEVKKGRDNDILNLE
jgi:hypothetical protein